MRVGIIALLQESNTFVHRPTTLSDFERDTLLVGEAIRAHMADAHHEVGGFFEGLEASRVTPVPIFAARATPSGILTADGFESLMSRLLAALGRAGHLDGLLVAAHGALVSQVERDVDGHWLTALRSRVGPGIPIVSTLDPHANLSTRMVRACDAMVAYRTNPHTDQRARGVEAAVLLARTLAGEIRPRLGAALPPHAIGIERQLTAEGPCGAWYDAAASQRALPGVLSNSPILGFPYADVEDMGASTVVVTDGDPELARRLARELARYAWDRRRELVGGFITPDAAVEQALCHPGRVCLLDMGDNVGGGSPADGTTLARALAARRVSGAFVCLCDPEAVARAWATGAGRRLRLHVGGKSDGQHGAPLELEVDVISLHEGSFQEAQPRHGGIRHYDQGRTAVTRTGDGLTLMLTSQRTPPWSLEQLRSCQLDPRAFRILVAKGVHAPVAAYQEVCDRFIRVDTPGVTCADMTRLRYHHRRRPMFPFEADTTWSQA